MKRHLITEVGKLEKNKRILFPIGNSHVVLDVVWLSQNPLKLDGNNVQLVFKPPSANFVTFDDVGGLHKAKQEIKEAVEYPLKYPTLYSVLDIQPPKAILLYGDAGCGKTLLARATANECKANFIHFNATDILSKWYGESEANLRMIFDEAKRRQPSIIFCDEIDAITPFRGVCVHEADRRVVSQFLVLLDGFNPLDRVVLIGATNRIDDIDPAILRSKRFDKKIYIGKPNRQERVEIFWVHTKYKPVANNVDLEELADITDGFTGADIALICTEASLSVLRRFIPIVEAEGITDELLYQITINQKDFIDNIEKFKVERHGS